MPSKRDQDILDLAKARFKQAEQADTSQRTRELDDLRFYAGDQWPQAIKDARAGVNTTSAMNGLPPVPARPCLVINKVREPVNQVLNQERQADMGIELVPADDFEGLTGAIDDTEIELREGLIRRIQRQSHAADARTWAFSRAVIAGRGYYRVMTRYAKGKTFDQEIFLERLYNQASVLLDPSHEQPDGSDAKWGFIGTDLPIDEYRAQFSKKNGKGQETNRVLSASDSQWRALGDEAPDWFTGEGETRAVRVVEYYYTIRETVTLYKRADGRTVSAKDYVEGTPLADEAYGPNTREDVLTRVKWCKIDGCQILEETDWPGQFIPIVKVTGNELQPYDKERRAEGMVRPARDSQIGFNAMVSKEVETIALTPIPPLSVEEGTIEGYEDWYAASTTRTLPYLPFKRTNLNGQEAMRPEVLQRQSQIGDIVVAVREFDQAIKSTTAVPDPTLGNIDPSLKSGKAIKFLLDQAQRGNSHFLDNLARSLNYEAQIINDLLYPIYGLRPGRLARLMNGQGEAQSVLIGQPFVMMGPDQQRPQPAPPGTPNAKTYQLTPDATFNVAIKVSKSYDTRREAQEALLGDLVNANPEFITWFGDLLFKYSDAPGHKELSERAKVMLAPPIQQLLNKEQPIPPQLQAQMAQMQQMVQQLSQLADKNVTDLKKAELQAQSDAQIKRMQEDAETERLRMKLAADIEQARITAAKQSADLAAEAQEERLALGVTVVHEQTQNELDRAHERDMAERQHAQALAQGAQQADSQSRLQAESAAQQPTPTEGA